METVCFSKRKSTHSMIAMLRLNLDQFVFLQLPRCGTSRRGRVNQALGERFQRGNTVIDGGQFEFLQWNLLAQPQQVRFAFQQLSSGRMFWVVERTLRTRHAVRALVKEVVS